MARLPDVAATGTPAPQPALGVAGFDPRAWRQYGDPGQVIESGGHDLQTAADVVSYTNARFDNLAAEDAFNKLKATGLQLQMDPKAGFNNVLGGNATDPKFVSGYLDQYKAKADEIAQSLANGNQRQLFQRRADVGQLQFQARLLDHQAQQSRRYESDVATNSILTERANVGAAPLDDSAFQASLARVYQTVADAAKRNGMPDQQVPILQRQEYDSLMTARLDALRISNPVAAQAMLSSNAGKMMSPEAFDKVYPHVAEAANPLLAAMLNAGGGVTGTEPQGAPATPGEQSPRGVRNNNPLNIVRTGSKWNGEVDGGDPRYSVFASPEAGLRAGIVNLLGYGENHGLNTVQGIVSRWAPATENDTSSYVSNVAKAMGVDPNAPLNLRDQATMTKLVKAMVTQENGQQPYTDDQIAQSITAAYTGQPVPTPSYASAPVNFRDMTPLQAASTPTGNALIDSLPPGQKLHVMQIARSQALQDQALLRQGMSQRLQDATQEYLSTGHASNSPAYDELVRAYGQVEGVQKWTRLQEAKTTGSIIQIAQNLPNAELEKLISTPPAAGEGFADRQRNFALLERTIRGIQKARVDDPAGYAIATKTYGFTPLDMRDPTKLGDQLRTRALAQDQIAADWQVRPQVLSSAETQQFLSIVKDAPVDTQKQYLAALYSGIGDDAKYKSVMAQIAPDQPMIAQAGIMQARGLKGTSGTDVADMILKGNRILNPSAQDAAKGGGASLVAMPALKDLSREFYDYVGNAFDNQPLAARSYIDAARAIYAYKIAGNSKQDGVLDSDEWKSAVQLATGRVFKYQGGNVIPPYGMPEDQFRNEIARRVDLVAPMAANMPPDMVRQAPLRNIGDTRYVIQNGLGSVMDSRGIPIVLDLSVPLQPPKLPQTALPATSIKVPDQKVKAEIERRAQRAGVMQRFVKADGT